MADTKTENCPKDWNDLWEPQNKERWAKKAAERVTCSEDDTTGACAEDKPIDWDMWQPSKKR